MAEPMSWDDYVAEHEGPELDAAMARLRGDDDPAAGAREPRVPSPDAPAGSRVQSPDEYINELEVSLDRCAGRLAQARRERDEIRKLFNRPEASVTHHRDGKLEGVDTSDEIDEALWTARDKVLSAAHSKDLDEFGRIGNSSPEAEGVTSEARSQADDAMHLSIDHRMTERNFEAGKLGAA